ncbi:hypothetical protein BH10PSE7_BH10PSE7_33730 [soil metagenome]
MTSFVVLTGVPQNARITMGGSDDLTVQAGGLLSVSANAQAVRFTAATSGAVINNSGTIEAVGGQAEPRAIRFENSIGANLAATINNIGSGSIIRSADDAIQIQSGAVTSGLVTVNNAGLIDSTGSGSAIDFSGAGGTFNAVISNTATGIIRAAGGEAIRIGSANASNSVTNSGTINGGSAVAYSGADGVDFSDNALGSVINSGGGTISGDRHAINAGIGSIITVTNNAGSTITGRNGSGVGSDGTASVTNFGTITGAFSDSPGSDINGPNGVPDGINDGDGDGIDVDGQATIINHGIIQGTGAGGHGSDNLPNTSEGIAAGGGTITNHVGASITGLGLGILIDDSSQGNAPFQTTVINDGTISGGSSFGIRIISIQGDVIENAGTISGGGGTAIQFGGGDDTLRIRNGSTINGLSDGGAGVNTLSYNLYTAGSVAVNLTSGAATGTGGVSLFQIVTGTDLAGSSDSLTGNAGGNQLNGLAGSDNLYGGAGGDTIDGGGGVDYTRYDDANYGNLVISLANPGTNTGAAAGDVFTDIEGVVGGAGNDTITGNGGNNYLFGTNGLDHLYGGLGADGLYGGGEVDFARYDDANYGNLVISLANAASNTGAAAGDTYNNIEGIVGGVGADTITGDGAKNYLFGSDGSDHLAGGLGGDQIYGGTGADFVRFDDGNYGNFTVSLANQAANTGVAAGDIYDNIEGVIGGNGDEVIIGNNALNYLFGQGGGDTFVSGLGSDIISVGAGGVDYVRFNTALGPSNIDTISNFAVADDTFQLSRSIFSVFGANGSLATVAPGAFNTGAAASQGDDRIIYNSATGALIYDTNGNLANGATQFATLSPGLALTAADFMIIA